MNKKLFCISFFLSLLCLTACNPAVTSETESEEPYLVKKYLRDNREISFSVGELYDKGSRNDYTYVYEYSDGSTRDFFIERIYSVEQITNVETHYNYTDTTFVSAGEHSVDIKIKADGDTIIASAYYDVQSGIEAGYGLKSISLKNELAYVKDEVFSEINPNLFIDVQWINNSETIYEVFSLNSEYITSSLTTGASEENVMNDALKSGKSYTFSAYLTKNSSKTIEETFTVDTNLGYYELEESTLVYDEFSNSAPHDGKANLLVVLIDFETGKTNEDEVYGEVPWTETNIQKVKDNFFGEKEDSVNRWNSLKTYYETTSLGEIEIDGFIADIYKPNPSQYTMKSILESNYPYHMLHNVFNDAVTAVQNDNPNIDWSTYDLNNDGYIDNLHFITNVDYNTAKAGTQTALWPHKYQIINPKQPNHDMPVAYIYEQTCLGLFSDQRTIIHEQGHVFGISDYYDYSYVGLDYVGCLDMQSHNVLDWNPFSKFSVGWSKPIVVDGKANSTTIRLKPGATTNQCLVIPANHDTYNGSAFDEYFLVELFVCAGNNEMDWKKYLGTQMTSAIRIYHVDARLVDYSTYEYIDTVEGAKEAFKNGAFVETATNNSFNWYDYPHGASFAQNYKLLTLLQNGGVNTFGKERGRGNEIALSAKDLFQTGHSFVFEDYDHFLNKQSQAVSTMNKGETFPYKITIQNVTDEEAIITVTKI